MDNQLLLSILATQQQILKQLTRMLPPRQEDIDISAVAYNPGTIFTLYVGVAGVVKGVDEENKPFNRQFIEGYHPFGCKSIDSAPNGTTATNLAACYAPTI